MVNHFGSRPRPPQPQTMQILDVPADVFEKYLAATGEAFAAVGAQPTQPQVQQALVQAAEKVGVTGAHAAHLAMRYSLMVNSITQHQALLLERKLMAGEAGPGKSTTFTVPFLASVARVPARFTAGQPICDMDKFWAMTEALAKLEAQPVAPAPEAKP